MKNVEEYTSWKCISNISEIKGKTIKEVNYNDDDELFIFFTDNTYLVIEAHGEDPYLDFEKLSVHDLFNYSMDGERMKLTNIGEIVGADLEKIKHDKTHETEYYAEQSKKRRYDQYLALKKEFENG